MPSFKNEHVDDKLNLKQELFCKLYASDKEFFGNGFQAYMEAYDMQPKQWKTAQANASRLLSNARILKRINELLELKGLNDAYVDKQLELLITQNSDYHSKVAAIKEYNALKSRVQKKLDVTSGGKPLEATKEVKELTKILNELHGGKADSDKPISDEKDS